MRAALFPLLTLATPAWAVPALLPVHGNLRDAAGEVVDGTVPITFALYEGKTGGSPVWSSTLQVDVTEGNFTAYLGEAEPLDLDLFRELDGPFLGIQVDTDGEMPRISLGSVAYAARAASAADADSLGGRSLDEIEASIPSAAQIEDTARRVCYDTPDELIRELDPEYRFVAGSGLLLDDDTLTFSVDPDQFDSAARDVCFDTEAELTALLDDNYVTSWSDLPGIPAEFADGTDADTRYTAGTGLKLSGTTFEADRPTVEAWAKAASFDTEAELTTLLDDNYVSSWSDLPGIPTGFADGTDNDTTYTAGPGLKLTGTTFETDRATIEGWAKSATFDTEAELTTLLDDNYVSSWSDLPGIPTGFADGTDNDTTYTAGAGLTLTGTAMSVNFAGSGTATTAARSDHTHPYATFGFLSSPTNIRLSCSSTTTSTGLTPSGVPSGSKAVIANIYTYHSLRDDHVNHSFGRNAGHTSYSWDNEPYNQNTWMNDVLITHQGNTGGSYYYGMGHGAQIIPLSGSGTFDAQLCMGYSSGTHYITIQVYGYIQ